MRLPDVLLRLLGREVAKPEFQRVDRILDDVDVLRVTVVPKRDRDAHLRASFARADRRLSGR